MQRSVKGVLSLLVVFVLAALASQAVPAQDQMNKIARVSVSQGETSYQRGDDQDWNALGANTPLMTGDSLYTAQDGRAEIELGDGNSVRLDSSTGMDIVNLGNDTTQLGLSQGYVNVRVRNVPRDRPVEVDTPLAAATLWEPGLYRIGLDGDGARFAVVSGRLSVVLNGEQLDVGEGEVLELQGGNDPSYGYGRISAGNAFDQWSEGRDTRWQRSTSSHYVHSAVIGYDDLDDNGSWRQDQTYGNVWYPSRVSNDWAPYQTGRWMWQDPYGWTWVSYESWGWAPYHYGRWVNVHNTWGWVPPPPMGYRGPQVVMNIQPYYSPALVAFIGGSNWNIGVSIGGGGGGFVGWIPLAPADPYAYAWQRPAPVTNVVYQNIYVNNSVTVVNYNNFTNGAVTRIPVNQDVIRRAPIMGHSVIGITPGRASLAPYPGVKLAPQAIPARAVMDRPLVVRSMPPPKPVAFDHKLAEIQKTGKPYARPVAIDANVGKPFQPGMKAPDGVKAKPALGPEGGTKQPKLKAKQGQESRPPKLVERDVIKPTERPQKDKQVQPPAQPGLDQPEKPKKDKQVQPPAQPGSEQSGQPQKNKHVQPPAQQPNPGQPEQPRKDKHPLPPAQQPTPDQPEQPVREKHVQPPAQQPNPGQPEQPRKDKHPLPPARQPNPDQPEQPVREKHVQPPAQQPNPGQPEQPRKDKHPLPPAQQPNPDQPGQPVRDKHVQPPAQQPNPGQPEQPRKDKHVQPPAQQPNPGQPVQPQKDQQVKPQQQVPPETPEEKQLRKAEERRKAEEQRKAEELRKAEENKK